MRIRDIFLIALCLILPLAVFAQEEAAEAEPEEQVDPLLAAVKDANTREVRSLLGDGADANTTTEHGMPLVSYAAMKGESDIVAALLESGADVEAADKTGATALMYAAQFDQDDVVDALIEAGANVNAADNLGWTPLIRAIIGGNIEAVRALMAAGADVNATDFFGRDALRVAEGRDLDDIVAVLNGTEPEAGS